MSSLEVVVTAIGSPAVLAILSAWLTNRSREKEKKLDWARQDEVAARVQKAAEVAAHTTERTIGKLDDLKKGQEQIHTLVNSNLTASMRRELDATIRELAGMNELILLKKKLGDEPTHETMAAIRSTETVIAELKATLNDRLAQTEAAEEKRQQ